jgi:hypothetical protein
MKWSVAVEADGDRVMTREEIVELADAVAMSRGIASGIGTSSYGAQVVVEADDRDDAVVRATEVFSAAVVAAGLPEWPVARAGVVGEADDDEDYFDDELFDTGEDS